MTGVRCRDPRRLPLAPGAAKCVDRIIRIVPIENGPGRRKPYLTRWPIVVRTVSKLGGDPARNRWLRLAGVFGDRSRQSWR
jgi:hypothetical protein